MNYYINFGRINKMRDEFTNAIFREDLIELYNDKDIAKKGIIEKDDILQKFKNVNSDPEFLKDIMQYEKDFSCKKIMKKTFKDEKSGKIVEDLLKLKQELRNIEGSIKYQYLKKYPEVMKQIDCLLEEIINMSIECQQEIEKHIIAKQKIVAFKYQDEEKNHKAQEEEKQKAEAEINKQFEQKSI